MTHHDGDWGLLASQQDEERARTHAVSDPADYHASIASRELHWFDSESSQWVSRSEHATWSGWHAVSAEEAENAAEWTPWGIALDDSAAPFFRWFVGGQTNACFNLLDRHVLAGRGAQQSVVFEGDRWDPSRMRAVVARI